MLLVLTGRMHLMPVKAVTVLIRRNVVLHIAQARLRQERDSDQMRYEVLSG
jgi:hypothetical protein